MRKLIISMFISVSTFSLACVPQAYIPEIFKAKVQNNPRVGTIPDVYTPYVKYSLENWFIIENNGIYLYIINDKDITYTLPILINKGEVKVLEQIIKYLEQEYLRYISVN